QRVQQLEGRIAQLTRQSPEPPGNAGAGASSGIGAGTGAGAGKGAGAGVGAAAGAGAATATGATHAGRAPLPSGPGGATRAMPAVNAPAAARASLPGAPAGVGAPALTAATKLIPTRDPAEAELAQGDADAQ